MNKKILIGLILALVVISSGCISSDSPKREADKTVEIDASGLQGDEEIRKFTFQDDGETINCYVYDQHDGYAGMGGMSCIPDGVSNR